jgi:hypothetical protein
MNILIVGHPADGGLMHLDVLGHVAKDKGFERLNPVVQKIFLKFDDALGHSINRPLTLVNAPDQPESGSEFFLDIFTILLGRKMMIGKDAPVKMIDLEPRNVFIVQVDHIFSFHFIHIDIGDDLLDHLSPKGLPRLGIQLRNEESGLVDPLHRNTQSSGNDGVISILQEGEML